MSKNEWEWVAFLEKWVEVGESGWEWLGVSESGCERNSVKPSIKILFIKITIDQIRIKIKEILSLKHFKSIFTMTLEVCYG